MLRPKEVVEKWVDAFNRADVDALVGLYHDTAVNHQVANEPVVGIAAIRDMFSAEFPQRKWSALWRTCFSRYRMGRFSSSGATGTSSPF